LRIAIRLFAIPEYEAVKRREAGRQNPVSAGGRGQSAGLGRALNQQELVRAIEAETGGKLSQSYLSQIESGARPHLTNTTRQTLASFFKVHPGYLVDDPEGYHPELQSDIRGWKTSSISGWLPGRSASGAMRCSNMRCSRWRATNNRGIACCC